ncbi:MAG: chemotaxis protein CheX [Spirochaetes bacterium]|nr:chemotaxis protein CheX [Spirochaetota bacterium]
MNKKLLSIFINAGSEVLYELLLEKAVPGKVSVVNRITTTQGLVVVIGMIGKIEGRIILDISPETSHKISEIILQESIDFNDSELIESAVSEMGNMIVGRGISALNEMGYSIKITPPTIFRGTDLKVIDNKNSQMLILPLATKIGSFILNLSVKEAEGTS